MKFCIFLFVVLAMVYASLAAVSFSQPSVHKDFPGQCYDKEEKKGYSVGTHEIKGKCYQIICGSDFTLQTQTCGAVGAPEGFHNEKDLSKPYPDCCIHIVPNKKN